MKNLFLISTLLLSFNVSAYEVDKRGILEDAQHIFEQEISVQSNESRRFHALEILTDIFEDSDSIFNLSIPKKGRKNIYLGCYQGGAQLLVGFEFGECVSFSLNSNGMVEYIPASLKGIKVGYAAGWRTDGKDAVVVQLNGVQNIRNVKSAYFKANSGISAVAGFEENWAQVGRNGAGKAFNTDAGINGGFRLNILNFDFQSVDIDHNDQSNVIRLPEYIVENLRNY